MLKVINNQAVKSDHDPKVGEFYGRVDIPESIYLVSSHYTEEGNLRFNLIHLTTGQAYGRDCMFIGSIFGNHDDKFYPITKDVTLTIG